MKGIEIQVSATQIKVGQNESGNQRTNFLGLFWALIFNMVKGVTEGYEKRLEMVGVGYRAVISKNVLDLHIGFTHPKKVHVSESIEVSVEKNTNILVKGIDKRIVGQFAAEVRSKKPPEPYNGKGIRYVGEVVRLKKAKSSKK
jgi:large subunit ribosomal protein L6